MKTIIAFILGAVLGGAGVSFVGLKSEIKPDDAGHGLASTSALDENEIASGDTAVKSAPAYLIVLGDVYDRDAFISGYAAKMPPLYAQFGGEYLAVGQNKDILEGEGSFQSYVISKWPSMDAARAFWNSEGYAPLRDARIDNNWGRFEVYLLEGMAPSAQ